MTQEEKKQLKENIEKLEYEQKSGILPIVREFLKDRANNSPHLVQFNLDSLEPRCL